MERNELINLADEIKKIEHVVDTNYWAKGDYERLYIEVESQNRFPNASTIYVDLVSNTVVAKLEKGKSGTKSYAWSQDVTAAVKALV